MGVTGPDFEHVVQTCHGDVYRFALSLTRNEDEAGDVTQETFHLWAQRGHQLREASRLKAWLLTTCYREFLRRRRHQTRFPAAELAAVEHELPTVAPKVVEHLDAGTLMGALQEVDELFRVPLLLFYFQQHSYAEIARLLGVPAGTVMSRLARGKEQLRARLADPRAQTSPAKLDHRPEGNVV
jgi:RNA polymerase sigma-70 factor (ECF subfamily)